MDKRIIYGIFSLMLTFSGYAQSVLWSRITDKDVEEQEKLIRTSQPVTFQLYSLNLGNLKQQLTQAPQRQAAASNLILPFPDGSGEMKHYYIYRADVMSPELTAKYPSIKSYVGRAVNNAAITIRFSVTQFGLHNMTQSVKGTSYTDPYTKNLQNYIVYKREGITTSRSFYCGVADSNGTPHQKSAADQPLGVASSDGILRTYRLAMACTIEYAAFHVDAAGLNDGTLEEKKEAVLAAMNVTMARVNGIYERDLSITMELIPNNDEIIFIDSDDFTNDNEGNALLNESQVVIDDVIGPDNYDIGHTVSTGGGGIAQLFSPCSPSKARGITGLPSPVGDPFDVDYVAHEIGHQFGGNHSYNNSCNGNRNESTAYEPGSGSTIMAYAGICPPNVQSNSDAHFHGYNIAEMSLFIANGGDCGDNEVTGNVPPVIDAGEDYTIPFGTPFILSGTATDANDDAMTYNWEQLDNEISEQPPVPTATEGPNFRSIPSKDVPQRFMPDIVDVLNNNLVPTWEVISDVEREFNFIFTVRDNNLLGGQVITEAMQVDVSGVAGPFMVTSPNTDVSWQVGTNHSVSWNVAGTTENDVDAEYVDIYLSTDGGFTYPITLAAKVPNDGSEVVAIPNVPGSNNRIMVKGYDHIFYDLSNSNFTITAPEATMAIAVEGDQNITDCAGNEINYTLTYDAYEGFDAETTFTTTGAPEDAVVSFTPDNITESGSVTMTVATTPDTAPEFYSITVLANAGGVTKTINVYLDLIDANFGTLNIVTPLNEEDAVFDQTSFDWTDANGAVGYEIEIATDAEFEDILVATTVEESTYTTLLEEATTYFWRIRPFNDACSGIYNEPNEFRTGLTDCEDYDSTDVPVVIPGNTVSTVTSTLVVADNIPIQKLTLAMNIGHGWVGDLTALLISPEGTQVELFDQVCEDQINVDAIFDDAGIELVCSGNPAITGIIAPDQLLSAFNGESPEGIWTLEVSDAVAQDGGVINNWSITICSTIPAPVGSVATTTINDFTLYPNPNNGDFTIRYTPNTGNNVNVTIYDIRGRQIFNTTYSNTGLLEQNLSLGTAEAGVYLVTVQEGNNRLTKKIVVQ